jgi:hypothetical protein
VGFWVFLVLVAIWKVQEDCLDLVGWRVGKAQMLAFRDESGAETFRLFRGKTETEWKYENKNGNLWNGNGNGIFLAEVETETEQRFPAEQMWKRKFPFPTNMEFPFYGCFAWPI